MVYWDMARKFSAATLIGMSVFLAGIAQAFAGDESRSSSIRQLSGHYFLVVWSYQGQDSDPVHAHTFTSFYRGIDLAKGVVRPATISWLPATGVVHPFGSEKGRNFSLDQTLQMACHADLQIKSWGPYEIKPALYQSAMRRIRLLNSGRVAYSMMMSSSGAMNCITAAGDLTPSRLDIGLLWGVAASAEVVRHLSPYFLGDGEPVEALAGISNVRACPARGGKLANNDASRSIAQSASSSLGH